MSGYFLSIDAKEDLIEIYLDGYQRWGEAQADRYQANLYRLFEHFGQYPNLGYARKDLGYDLRSFPYEAHMVFFMPWKDETAIVRVMRGEYDFPEYFQNYDPLPGIVQTKDE